MLLVNVGPQVSAHVCKGQWVWSHVDGDGRGQKWYFLLTFFDY